MRNSESHFLIWYQDGYIRYGFRKIIEFSQSSEFFSRTIYHKNISLWKLVLMLCLKRRKD